MKNSTSEPGLTLFLVSKTLDAKIEENVKWTLDCLYHEPAGYMETRLCIVLSYIHEIARYCGSVHIAWKVCWVCDTDFLAPAVRTLDKSLSSG